MGRAAEARPVVESAGRFFDAHLARSPEAPHDDLTWAGRGGWLDWYSITILLREAAALMRQAEAANKAAPPANLQDSDMFHRISLALGSDRCREAIPASVTAVSKR